MSFNDLAFSPGRWSARYAALSFTLTLSVCLAASGCSSSSNDANAMSGASGGTASSAGATSGATGSSGGAASAGSDGGTTGSGASASGDASSMTTGSSGSSGVTGTSEGGPPLLSATTGIYPAPGATGVCVDVPLRLTFASQVKLGTSGKIQIFDASQPDTPVDAIDLSAPYVTDAIATRGFHEVVPVFLDGSDAVIYFRHHALKADKTYFVTVDPGVFVSADDTPMGAIADPSAWQFSTVAPAPASPTELVVSREGGGDFCTVQGAVDFVPSPNPNPVTITIKNGTYHEIVLVSNKSNLTFRGEDRHATVIAYPNNDALQKMGGGQGGTKVRATFATENSDDLLFENLTIHNTTPQGGSQAEALRVDPGNHVILRNIDVISRQDTLLLSGRVYVTNSYVEGNVDFIWGKGIAYFENCEIKTVARAGYGVQARNTGTYGYVFVDSKLTADPGITGHMLARIDVGVYPRSQVSYVNCQLGPHVDPKGWLITTTADGGVPDTSQLQFSEYQSVDPNGQPVDVSMRDPASKQLTADEAASMRDKATVFGDGWSPTP